MSVLDTATLEALAARLEDCELQARDTLKITLDHPDMDWDDAYAVQDAILRRKRSRGARIVGLKDSSGDMAYAIWNLRSEFRENGKLVRERVWNESGVFRRLNGYWKIALIHSSLEPKK